MEEPESTPKASKEGRHAMFAIGAFFVICIGWFIWMLFIAPGTLHEGLQYQIEAGNPKHVVDRLAPLLEDGKMSEELEGYYARAEAYLSAQNAWSEGNFLLADERFQRGFPDAAEYSGEPPIFGKRLKVLAEAGVLAKEADGYAEAPEGAASLDERAILLFKRARTELPAMNEAEKVPFRNLLKILKSRDPENLKKLEEAWPAFVKSE